MVCPYGHAVPWSRHRAPTRCLRLPHRTRPRLSLLSRDPFRLQLPRSDPRHLRLPRRGWLHRGLPHRRLLDRWPICPGRLQRFPAARGRPQGLQLELDPCHRSRRRLGLLRLRFPRLDQFHRHPSRQRLRRSRRYRRLCRPHPDGNSRCGLRRRRSRREHRPGSRARYDRQGHRGGVVPTGRCRRSSSTGW